MINTSAILQAGSIKELQDFVTDFDLKKNSIICFDAVIEYEIADFEIVKKESQVQVITSDNFYLVYLMSDTINPFFLPDIFNCNSELFEYVHGQRLKIHSMSTEKYGPYTVSIYPKIEE